MKWATRSVMDVAQAGGLRFNRNILPSPLTVNAEIGVQGHKTDNLAKERGYYGKRTTECDPFSCIGRFSITI